MMKIKTSDLTGAALDWAVCKAGGERASTSHSDICRWWDGRTLLGMFNYSTNWGQGGPIIERENISVEPWNNSQPFTAWSASMEITVDQYGELFEHNHFGETPLIAAMRCYVASKLGDEVDIPEGILK